MVNEIRLTHASKVKYIISENFNTFKCCSETNVTHTFRCSQNFTTHNEGLTLEHRQMGLSLGLWHSTALHQRLNIEGLMHG